MTEVERCLAALTLAFASDPPCRWSWPDPGQYLDAFPRFARAFGGAAFDRGTAHYCERNGRISGVAMWLPPGSAPDEPALVQVIHDTVAPETKAAMISMFEQFDAYHPRTPHWHLPLIGVDPTCQSQGIGSALQRHVLVQCDRDQVPAYLEATSPRNVPLYERLGFKVLGRIQVADSPPVFPMLREPMPSKS